jgi:signal transduction histidine kinase/ActR/RegA family two-component response regulator
MANLRILFVEDDPLDAELALRELHKSGFNTEWQRVDTKEEFTNRLAQDPPDVIISDHVMPQFSSAGALQCLNESGLMIPFIVVSHAIGEEQAVGLMRDGAADFLMKDRLGRLGEAVRHALNERQLRAQYAEAQQDLRLLNQDLEKRIVERTAELKVANNTLEERVAERTQELATSYARLRTLATDLTVAEQTERRRLATELHDYLAQLLVVIRMKVGQLLKLDQDPEPRKILQDADQLLRQSLDYTRTLVSELAPRALYERGLGVALQWLGDQMVRQKILNVEIALDSSEQPPLPETDAVLLFHSIRELLFNVLKHGKTDRASVSMRYAQNVLSLTVSDHGAGFDVARLRGDCSDRFGLLSIRERMAAIGGSFDIQSEQGKGTIASLHLPLTASGESIAAQVAGGKGPACSTGSVCGGSPDPPLTLAVPVEAGVLTPLRVVIVDDHQLVREGLHCILMPYHDLTVVGEASTGEQALQLAGTLRPDVVIMDVQMPGWDGAESTRRILKEHPSIVVIGLSIQTEPYVAQSMLEAGAAAFLPKDTIATELYAAIRTAVRRRAPSNSLTSHSLA